MSDERIIEAGRLDERALLNFYSNSDFYPLTDFSFNLGENSFLGYDPTKVKYKKASILDVDGVLNAKDADPLYKDFLLGLREENPEVKNRLPEILKNLKILQTPGREKEGEILLTKTFRQCDLTEEQINNACEESAKKFIKQSLISGAKDFIRKLDEELGYTPAILSASPKIGLDMVADYLKISPSDVYATNFLFSNRKLRTVEFMLGERRLNAKNKFLKNRIDTKYGCYFIVDDDPLLNLCTLKSGLNPTIIVGDMPREKLPLDVSIWCSEAKDNLLNLIKPILRYEYAWLVYHLMDEKTIYQSFSLASEQKRLFQELMDNYSQSDLQNLRGELKEKFTAASIQIIDIKSKFGLISKEEYIRHQISRFLAEQDENKEIEIAEIISNYFRRHIPESNSDGNSIG